MANPDSVSQLTAANFGNFAIASAYNVPLGATGNAVVNLPFLSGGLTAAATAAASGEVIIRRITVQNPSGNVSTANISILTSNDGNASNAVVSAVALANLTTTGLWQDVTIASPYSVNTAINGLQTQALFVKVNTAVANGTVDIRVYGDLVTF